MKLYKYIYRERLNKFEKYLFTLDLFLNKATIDLGYVYSLIYFIKYTLKINITLFSLT